MDSPAAGLPAGDLQKEICAPEMAGESSRRISDTSFLLSATIS